jgi:hypothetical protein
VRVTALMHRGESEDGDGVYVFSYQSLNLVCVLSIQRIRNKTFGDNSKRYHNLHQPNKPQFLAPNTT